MSFLQHMTRDLYSRFGEEIQHLKLVFPNRRAGLYFREHLAQQIAKPIWAPEVLSIEEFIHGHSGLRVADKISLVFRLHTHFSKIMGQEDAIDRFFYWGEMLLRDFDEIDKYLVKPEEIFVYLKEQKRIDQTFGDGLTEEQIDIIRSFWESFGENNSKEKGSFLKIWEKLQEVYQAFVDDLNENKLAYSGMSYRKVAEDIAAIGAAMEPNSYVFAGFNALTPAEEKIMRHLIQEKKALAYWDVDAYYLDHSEQEAGLFLREYRKDPVFGPTFPKESPFGFGKNAKKDIQSIAVPLRIGQAKMLGQMLKEDLAHLQPARTAIILADEQMLFPVLHSLPKEIKEVNVTMGFPLKQSPLYGLLEYMLEMQQEIKPLPEGGYDCPFKIIEGILLHPYLQAKFKEEGKSIYQSIKEKNSLRVSLSELAFSDTLMQAIFKKIETTPQLGAYLIQVLTGLFAAMEEESNGLEKDFILHFYGQINVLQEQLQGVGQEMDMKTYLRLFRQVFQQAKIPFTGEPLKGIQIMGVLETRVLDFDRIYLLGMNEEAFPPKPSLHSFIPYNLRRAYALPTFDKQDAIYAYHFYRLAAHAKDIRIFYNNSSQQQMNADLSRYVKQLAIESGLEVKEHNLQVEVNLVESGAIEVEKSPEVLQMFDRYLAETDAEKEKSTFTPSALNTYFRCSLQFYFRYGLRLFEEDEHNADLTPQVLGDLLHHAMEILYTRLGETKKSSLVEARDFELLEAGVNKAVEAAFRKYYRREEEKGFVFAGKNLLAKGLVIKIAKQILGYDKADAPFRIVGLEETGAQGYRMNLPIQSTKGKQYVQIKGIIDRIDEKDGVIRIIDYKTGKAEKHVETIPSLFDPNIGKKRNSYAFQTFLYALLYYEKTQTSQAIQPGLYNVRELFKKEFDMHFQFKGVPEGPEKGPILDIHPYLPEFKSHLIQILEKIYDMETPFTQTQDRKICEYCAYAGICARN